MMTRSTLISVTLVFVLGLIAAVTLKVFYDPEPVPSGTVQAFAAFIGACGLAGLVELVKARRSNKQ